MRVTESTLGERQLVRRVVTTICLFALLTVPLMQFGLGASASWVGVANLLVLTVAFGALGIERVRLRAVIGFVACLLLTTASVSMWRTAGDLAAGGPGTGLGTGLLWVAVGIGPAVFLVLSLRVALAACAAAAVWGVVVVLVGADWQVGRVLRHPGVGLVSLGTLVVVATAATVAWLARRRADERREAARGSREAFERTARLEAEQERRARVFGEVAAQLRVPMASLVAASQRLREARAGDTTIEHVLGSVEESVETMREQVVVQLDRIVAGLRVAAAPDPVPAASGALPTRHGAAAVVAAAIATCLVALDLSAMLDLAAGPAVDPNVATVAANRMVVVLFVAVAIVVVVLPGALGWGATVLLLAAHPTALLLGLDRAVRDPLVLPYVAAWRMAVLGSGMLSLLALVIERRVRERDELVAAAAAAEARGAELRRREEAVDRAHAEATHELKSPLSVVHGAAKVLREREAELAPDQRDALVTALLGAVDRLDQRLAAMRSLTARGEAAPTEGPAVLAASPRPVAQLLAETVAAAGASVQVELEVDVDTGGAATLVAGDALLHVVENLVGNAEKYGDGSPVRVTARLVGDEVALTVANRGGRLRPADAARMFEPYWRSPDNDDAAEGVGLGLAIVTDLVQRWDGRCWATVDGPWTTVGVSLPATVWPVATPVTPAGR